MLGHSSTVLSAYRSEILAFIQYGEKLFLLKAGKGRLYIYTVYTYIVLFDKVDTFVAMWYNKYKYGIVTYGTSTELFTV